MIRRVLHTGVAVANLGKAIELYKGLGFEVTREFEKPEPKARVASVKKGETAFELWQFEDKTHPLVQYIRNHIALGSDDLERDIQSLVDDGYKLVIPITQGVVLRYAFVQDAVGSCFEIAADSTSEQVSA